MELTDLSISSSSYALRQKQDFKVKHSVYFASTRQVVIQLFDLCSWISLLDTHRRDPRSVSSRIASGRRTAMVKIHEFAWKFLLQLQLPLEPSESVKTSR
jgi:hypothetical protein